MKTIIITVVFLITSVTNLPYAQNRNDKNKPDERIEVNKEYDEHGNLIRYDSIYSYSSTTGTINRSHLDSIFKDFFPNQHSSFFGNSFELDESIFTDSFMHIDSIWKQRMLDQKSLFDHFFESKPQKKDTTYIKKQGKI
ncbi:hypothetical protein [Aquimarina sp. RZ0]|uniref:hypothetical protein n=1 Tax=Aquimarina sp. RZ0 TaxID=2607730 RepID=UPI0011F21476|nr:hypothetical protein [Aquimarina sp. RZ0]KAA1246634.1 hypothetical protein F0000_07050 [Aquimarina sp. RZ0]